jgi:peptidoglycan hydrolase CwlO-like protein
MRWLACAVCLTFVVGAAPEVALGASSASIAASLRAKKAQAAAIEVQLKATRDELTAALAKVAEADAQLQDTRDEIAATADTIAGLDAQITASEAVLNERAVAMYKSGGLDMLEALLSVNTLDDLLTRIDLLGYIQQTDGQLVAGLTTSRDQSAYLQGQQATRENDLIARRQEADARTAVVTGIIARQQALMRSVSGDIGRLVKQEETARAAEAAAAADSGGVAGPPGVAFNPNTVISDAKYHASGSMSLAQIQGFLNAQSGSLKSYSTRDHAGVVKSTAQMIADAAGAWGISPKVILVTMQKEQSLLSDASPSQRALDWALGCGKMDGSTLSQYQGFGNQIWFGARALSSNATHWSQGISISIDGSAVYPSNGATHAQYRYTPHFHGVKLFWSLYWRYFGNPVS